MARLIRFLTVT